MFDIPKEKYRFYAGLVLFFVYVFALVYGEYYHELWRDEVRALSVAKQAQSWFDLPNLLRNEGHPILWYSLLFIGYKTTGSVLVLPILSLFFAFASAYLLLFKSPFPIWFSCLYLFGFWGLYSYGINCRNYGIAAFLMFWFVHVRRTHKDRVFIQALLLFLAVQTNAYMSVFAIIVAFQEFIFDKNRNIKTIGCFSFVMLSFVLQFLTTMPDSSSQVVTQFKWAEIYSFWDIGYGFNGFLYSWFPYKHGFLTLVFYLCLLPFVFNPKAFIGLWISAVFMCVFSLCVRDNFLHHQGMYLVLLLSYLFLYWEEIFKDKKRFKTILRTIGLISIIFLLVNNLHRGFIEYTNDLKMLKTDALNASRFFAQHQGSNEVWIAEPDYIMEPIMYGVDHAFYLPRENRFNTYVHFTKANDSILHLSKILSVNDSFMRLGKTCLIVLEHKVQANDSFYQYSMKRFELGEAAKQEFLNHYQLLDSFIENYYTDEHYYIYRKKSS